MVSTRKGILLAFCAARKGSGGDWDPIEIVVRRSLDSGETWEPLKRLVPRENLPCDNAMPIVDFVTGEVHLLYQIDYARCYYIKSGDDGQTWSDPVDITETIDDFNEIYPWVVQAPGPGHGIQLVNGRLEVPFWLSKGPQNIEDYSLLRSKIDTKIAGGEIVTTEAELCKRIEKEIYDIIQPDATVIGGISPVLNVFSAARRHGIEVVVHCWGGPVGMMANFHAALAGGGSLIEWPIPAFPLRNAMVDEPWKIVNGLLEVPDASGLGVRLTKPIETEFTFREEPVYTCLVDGPSLSQDDIWD